MLYCTAQMIHMRSELLLFTSLCSRLTATPKQMLVLHSDPFAIHHFTETPRESGGWILGLQHKYSRRLVSVGSHSPRCPHFRHMWALCNVPRMHVDSIRATSGDMKGCASVSGFISLSFPVFDSCKSVLSCCFCSATSSCYIGRARGRSTLDM